MKPMNTFLAIALGLAVASSTLACEQKGALEEAGEKVDNAIDDITHPGEGPLEEAGRKAGEQIDEMKEGLAD